MSDTPRGERGAYLALLTTMVLFGSAFPSSKAVVEEVPHEVAAALRFGGGALVLLVVAAVAQTRSAAPAPSRAVVARSAGVGLIGVLAYNVFFFWGLSLAPSIDGSIIVPVLSPVLTALLLLALGWERGSSRRLIGLAGGVVGAVVFFAGLPAAGEVGASRLVGDLIFLLGALTWAVYSIASKRVLGGIDPLRATTIGTSVGALGLLALALPELVRLDWTSLSTTVWVNVVYLAVGPTAIAYLCYFHGLRSVSPATATVAMFTVPLFGAVGGAVFLGERVTVVQMVGAAVMLVGALSAATARSTIVTRTPVASAPSGHR